MRRNYLRYRKGNVATINFLKKLAILTEAGMPIADALDSAAVNDSFRSIAEKVRSGGSFSGALEADHFPPAVIGIVSVSETNGALSAGLGKACRYLEKKDAFRKKVLGALLYPGFVMMICCVSVLILVSVLLPSFAGIYRSLGATLPPLSGFILASAGFFPLIVLILAALSFFAVRFSLSDKGFILPVIGKFRRKLILASFCGSMAESLLSGMSVEDSLSLSAGVVSSVMFREKLAVSRQLLLEGNSLNASLNITGMFDDTALSLMSAGERSSSLGGVFSRLSDLYEEEIESGLKAFTSIIEPASTLVTGLVVGIIVFAMFMPIIKLINVLGS